MNLCLVSDTHQQRMTLLRAVQAVQPVDAVLHAGDEVKDALWLRDHIRCPVYAVAGNWDSPGADHPLDRIVEWDGLRLYLTHGHRLGVKENPAEVVRRAKLHQVHVAVFGHTHMATVQHTEGILLINPGSLSLPRGRRERTFACLSARLHQAGWEAQVRFYTPEGHLVPELCLAVALPHRHVDGGGAFS
ncbi:phosphoesterase [Alicyclobacillus cellulosilyticus]|uniref:Phosphoesterase n=1 Tax=Alicyclobacillus cellulosilyticus TaxID=1003997 RepID=A0A917K1M9_9BACL|nr:metallophosphoesterase [Alicyclobacillus cellulosilyticus]GGI96389.1 phosphoesterase [Alicyclobacillus cellulosilyticus]